MDVLSHPNPLCPCSYADKYDEEFQPHLPSFTTAIWDLLKSSGTSGAKPKYDAVTNISMRFLASLASKQVLTHSHTALRFHILYLRTRAVALSAR